MQSIMYTAERKLTSLPLVSEFNFIHILHAKDISSGALIFIHLWKISWKFHMCFSTYCKESYSAMNPLSIKMKIERKKRWKQTASGEKQEVILEYRVKGIVEE